MIMCECVCVDAVCAGYDLSSTFDLTACLTYGNTDTVTTDTCSTTTKYSTVLYITGMHALLLVAVHVN